MTRHRPARVPSLHRVSSWLLAASGVVLYAWAPLIVPGETLRGSSALPWWLPWIAPPVLYGLLLVGLPGLTAVRRIAGTVALCALHAGLTLVVPPLVAELGGADPEPWLASLWGFPAAPVIQLLAVPLIAFPLRDLLVPPSRRGGFEPERTPTPSPLRTGRGWDDAGTHTVGGERLREGAEATAEWARTPRDLGPSRIGQGRTDTTKLAARTPTPPRFRVDAPATEPPRPVASLSSIDTDVLAPAPPVAPEPTPAPARVESPPPVELPPPAPGPPTIDTDVFAKAPPVAPAPAPAVPSLAAMDTAPLVHEAPVVPAPPPPPPAPSLAAMDTEPLVAPAPASPPSLATMDTEPLVRETPAAPAPAPPAPSLATLDTEPLVRTPAAPEPVLVTPPLSVRIVETPAPPPLPRLELAEIARTLAPVGALEVVEQTLMGMALYTACGSRLASAVVAHAAFRTMTFLAETPAAGPVTQTTLRGAAGALVVTPLGPRSGTGPALAVALPQRGALALLEILGLRVAAEYRAAHSLETPPPASAGTAAGTLQPAPVPARVGALVRSLASGTSLQPVCLRDATGGLTVHLLLEPGADAERLARLASSLYRIVEAGAEPGGIGPVQSIAVRLGSQRIVVQPVTAAGGPAALLVAATDHRPGLTRLQLERVAARLGGTPS